MSAPLTILCAGAYGIQNAGDDLPLVCLMDTMRGLLPDRDLRFRVLSRHPDPWEERQYGVVMVKNLEHDSAAAARGRKFLGFNPGDDPRHLERIKAEVAACNLLVLGAGNALIDQTIGEMRGPVSLMALYGRLARRAGRPVMLYGMSVGPLRTEMGRELARELLASSRVVSVRDEESRQLCCALLGRAPDAPPKDKPEIWEAPDATLAAESPGPERARRILADEGLVFPPGRPVLALGLRDLARPLGEHLGRRLKEAVLEMMARMQDEAAFLFLPQSTYVEDDDRELARWLAARAPSGASCLMIRQRHHPRDLIALYGLASGTIAARLHAAVFSTIACTPVVGINYLPKVKGFMDKLGEAGRILDPDDLDGDHLTAAARDLLVHARRHRGDLELIMAVLRRQAKLHACLAVWDGLGILPDKESDP